MSDIFNELSQLLEKTNVVVEIDKTITGYLNYSQSEVDEGIQPDDNDKYYYCTVIVDDYTSFEKYCEKIDFLIENFTSVMST